MSRKTQDTCEVCGEEGYMQTFDMGTGDQESVVTPPSPDYKCLSMDRYKLRVCYHWRDAL